MKATLEFNLPADTEAFLDAIHGARWREFAGHAENHVSMLRDTQTNPECRDAFLGLKMWLRDERAQAGLTYVTDGSLRRYYAREEKRYTKRVAKHYKKQAENLKGAKG